MRAIELREIHAKYRPASVSSLPCDSTAENFIQPVYRDTPQPLPLIFSFDRMLAQNYCVGELVSELYESVIETFPQKILLIIPVDTILPGDPIYKLNFSVDGVVECTIDGFVIGAPIFDEEGYGETYESAWDDLLSSIRDRYASLVKREQGLSPPDRKVLSELRKYLSEAAQ